MSNLARLVVVVWIFVVLILNSTYTASLSARLTVSKLDTVDRDISALKENGDYVGCRDGSFIVDFLISLGFNKTKIKTYKRPEEFHYALSNGNITAMFARTPYTNLFLSKYCNQYMTVGPPLLTEGLAFVSILHDKSH